MRRLHLALLIVAACGDGVSDPSLLSREDPEPVGATCPHGGTAIREGRDANHDGVLDPGEVQRTDYVCNGDADVWDATACHGGTHVSPEERAAFQRLCDWGLVDAYRRLHAEPERYSWWDYRAGMFHKNYGMRIDHCLVSQSVAARVVWAEIDREARKGKPIPSDHAPVVLDVDEPGRAFDAGWAGAMARVAGRRAGQ